MTKKDDVNLAVIDAKMDFIKEKVTKIEASLEKINDKIDDQDNRIVGLEAKNSLTTWALVGFTTLASAIAAWLGVKT